VIYLLEPDFRTISELDHTHLGHCNQASAQLPHIVDALERHDSEHASLLKELFAEALAEVCTKQSMMKCCVLGADNIPST
jgi:hypothetical protein